jgi:hypothetical protein
MSGTKGHDTYDWDLPATGEGSGSAFDEIAQLLGEERVIVRSALCVWHVGVPLHLRGIGMVERYENYF